MACVFRPPSSAEAPAEQPPPPPAKEAKKEGKGKVDKDAPDGMHEYLVILADHHLLDMPIESLQVRSRRFVTDVVGGMLQEYSCVDVVCVLGRASGVDYWVVT